MYNKNMIKEIIQRGNDLLKKVSLPVSEEEFNTPKLSELLSHMHDTLAKEKDGVALAAPQIAVNKRIFVVAPFVYKKQEDAPLVYINPEIIKTSRRTKTMEEGCLSVRPWYGKTKRHSHATVRAFDEHGNVFERGGSKLLAQIFQHEIDHLDGILFSDHATDLEEIEISKHE
ncbi:MAG: peptide deformylase [Flavobacteriaceae bacterium]|jgi:peptide deformylase